MVAKGKLTENKFSMWCKSRGYYRIKLQVDVSNVSLSGKMQARSMPSDYFVMTPDRLLFVETKEVSTADSFGVFRQQSKLTKLSQRPQTGALKHSCYLLINFVAYGKVIMIEINEYNELLKNCGKKNLKLSMFPEKNIFNWSTLTYK